MKRHSPLKTSIMRLDKGTCEKSVEVNVVVGTASDSDSFSLFLFRFPFSVTLAFVSSLVVIAFITAQVLFKIFSRAQWMLKCKQTTSHSFHRSTCRDINQLHRITHPCPEDQFVHSRYMWTCFQLFMICVFSPLLIGVDDVVWMMVCCHGTFFRHHNLLPTCSILS